MSARNLVLGLDGADLELVLALGQDAAAQPVRADGARCVRASTQRAAARHAAELDHVPDRRSAPGDTACSTSPRATATRVQFTAGTVREAPTLIARLDKLGMRCACVGFPATWPPGAARSTACSSAAGMRPSRSRRTAPSSGRAPCTDSSRGASARCASTRSISFAPISPAGTTASARGWPTRSSAVPSSPRYLLATRAWDVFAFYFGESDTASHYLCSLYDEGSPRRPAQVSEAAAHGPRCVCTRRSIAPWASWWPRPVTEVEITIVSDHGSGGSSDKVLYLNRALSELGLLTFKPARRAPRAARLLKRLALESLSPRLRDRLFRLGSARAAQLARVAGALRRHRHEADGRLQRRAQLLPRGLPERARARAAGHHRAERRRAGARAGKSGPAHAARSRHGAATGQRRAHARGAVRGAVRRARARTCCSSCGSIAATATTWCRRRPTHRAAT